MTRLYDEEYTTAQAVDGMMFHGETFTCWRVCGRQVNQPVFMYFTPREGFCVKDAPQGYYEDRYREEMKPGSVWRKVEPKQSNTLRSFMRRMIDDGLKVAHMGWNCTGYIQFKDGWFVDEDGRNVPLDFFDDDDLRNDDWMEWDESHAMAYKEDKKSEHEPSLESTIHAICDLLLAAAVKSIEDRGTITESDGIQKGKEND
jgi:hypothetical protein